MTCEPLSEHERGLLRYADRVEELETTLRHIRSLLVASSLPDSTARSGALILVDQEDLELERRPFDRDAFAEFCADPRRRALVDCILADWSSERPRRFAELTNEELHMLEAGALQGPDVRSVDGRAPARALRAARERAGRRDRAARSRVRGGPMSAQTTAEDLMVLLEDYRDVPVGSIVRVLGRSDSLARRDGLTTIWTGVRRLTITSDDLVPATGVYLTAMGYRAGSLS